MDAATRTIQRKVGKMTNIQAINLLKDLEQSLDDYCELNDEGKTAFRMAITALEVFGNSEQLAPAHPEPQWIPCSERLPDKTDDYLCSYNGCAVADICEYDPDRNEWGFFYDGGWKVVSNVIAWLPLPEPYTERRKE